MKKKRKIIEKKIEREVKIIKEKREQPTLEKEILRTDEAIDLRKLNETLKAQKTAVLERVIAPQRKVQLEDQVPKTNQAKKDDDVKYGTGKVDYGTGKDNEKAREISYGSVTEYATPNDQNRRVEDRGMFDPSIIDRDKRVNQQRAVRDVKSEYGVKKRKYE